MTVKTTTKDTNLENIKKDNPVKNTQSATTQSTASKADMTNPAADKPDKNAETAILIKGEGVSKEVSITMSQIKAMKDQVAEYTYFSCGKEPKTACNTYKGVKLSYLLGLANVKSTAQKVTIVAADGYTATFSIIDVNAMLMDETDSSKKLPMLIAFAEDGKMLNYGSGYNLRLVVGQKCEGDYNRQYWVSEVSCIIVK